MNAENKMPDNSPIPPSHAPEEAVIDQAPAIPAGRIGQRLVDLGHTIEHLGNDAKGTEMIRLTREQALTVANVLRHDAECTFDMMLMVTGLDWKTHRESVYHLNSTTTFTYLIVKIAADEQDHSPSLMPVWHACDWHEREAYDLFGINYDGHPDLRRILMPNYWLGHPLRKDYVEDDPRLVWNRR